MVGRRQSPVAAAGGAAQASAQDGQRLVIVYNGEAHIDSWRSGLRRRAVQAGRGAAPRQLYIDVDAQRRMPRCGPGLHDRPASPTPRRRARRAEINATEAEALAAEVAKNGLSQAAKAKGAVNVPGHVVIQRAYTFTELRGPLPLRRGAQRPAHRHHRPGDVVHGRRRRVAFTSTDASARRTATSSAASRRRRPGAGRVHVPPRWSALPATPTRTCRPPRSRCASPTPAATSTPDGVTEWAERPPGARRGLPEELHHEVHGPDRDQRSARPADAPSTRTSCRRSSCPNKTGGYQRKAWR